MELGTNLFLSRKQITPDLRSNLRLPNGVWQLVVNRNLTAMSYMDAQNRVHHAELDDARRHALVAMLEIQ